jgi:L-alanine-DL-glutamate epimerase-like enolase superfamily enzyme
MAAAAHMYSVELGHHEEPQVAVHLLASQPHGTYAEVFHPNRDPIWWKVIANRPEVVDGCFALPEAPGFGWELDREFVDKHTVEL